MKEKEVLEEMSFMGQDLYSFVHDYTASCFAVQEVLKESVDASICRLLHIAGCLIVRRLLRDL